MSRRTEAVLRQALLFGAVASILIAVALAVYALVFPPPPISVVAIVSSDTNFRPQSNVTSNPKLDNLSAVKMTRTVSQKSESVAKPPAPELSTLIQLRGIFAYGDPKDSEAMVETLRANQTAGYKVGDTVKGVAATVVKIEKNVTFAYDGKNVVLEIKSGERSSYAPVAIPGDNSPSVANQK